MNETFEAGSIPDTEGPLYVEHSHLNGGLAVGQWTGRADDTGYQVSGKFYRNDAGQAAHADVKAGKLTALSVGFIPTDTEDADGITRVRSANLNEVSVVKNPAYPEAKILAVRTETTDNTSDDTEDEDTEKETDVTDTQFDAEAAIQSLTSKLDALADKLAPVPDPTQGGKAAFRSLGEVLKGLARGDKDAQMLIRAADATAPATSGQAGEAVAAPWLSEPLRFVQQRRPLTSFFSRAPLPDAGMSVNFPVAAGSAFAGADGAAVAEGTDLAYAEVEIVPASANVNTYGNYIELTKQAIERGDSNYLTGALEFSSLMYARDTETALRTVVNAAGTPYSEAVASLAASTKDDWMDIAMGAAALIEDQGTLGYADALLVSRSVYARLAAVFDWDFAGNGQSFTGSGGIVRQGGNIGDLPVVVVPGLTANFAAVANAGAVRSWESAGAPFRAQDDNVVNLTSAYSVYGYFAAAVRDAASIKRITITAA